ncbi:MAG: asparagine synthase (glutamine-hydrolyzing) [Acidiferrobacterales bacterium]
MCGIAGIAALRGAPAPSRAQIKPMCDTIAHRGPDGEGIAIRDGVALGMRRLAIIDVRGGSQPIYNEDRTISTVYNGEIYNFREMRRDLQRAGYVFSTQCDTEVIVHAYEHYGPNFAGRLNGMFAFALHDARQRKLILARDPLGIKPLYYALTPEYLVWGSEIKALLASGLIERELDIDALGEFLAWEYVPGTKTLFAGIHKLQPGEMLEVDFPAPQASRKCYWDIPNEKKTASLSAIDWEEAVSTKIKECVQRQLVSDVPLGAFLSGGVDSSLVVASMGRATTFSIGFEDPSYNELRYSARAANHLGVEHITEIINPKVADLFEKLMYFMDDPIGDFSIFPTYLVSRLARDHVTVALSGDGGDELFGGYETYVADERARYYNYVPKFVRNSIIHPWIHSLRPRPSKKGFINKLKRFVEGMEQPASLGHTRWRVFASDILRNELFTDAAARELTTPAGQHIQGLFCRAGDRELLNRSLYVDVKSYLCDNCLVKVDRMSMAVSLEARVPLLDKELVELAFRIPPNLKVSGSHTKMLLKHLAARKVPPECVYRPKEGFSIPIKQWLGTQFRPIMEDLLDKRKIEGEGLFKSVTIERLKHEHLTGIANHSHVLWALIVFHAWRRRWLDGEV